MAPRPRVSIVTPSYNQGPFIRDTIESVLSQDYPDLEYLVMDGGSTDGTLDILREYASDSRLRWTSGADGGQAAAIGEGFAKTGGTVMAWLNSDDFYLPGAVSRAVAEMERSGAEFVYGDALAIDGDGRFLRHLMLPGFHPELFRLGWGLHQPSTFWRRELYERAGGVDARWYCVMDRDLFWRMTRLTRPLHVREAWSAMRFHASAKTTGEFSSRCWSEVVELQAAIGRPLPLLVPKALPRFHRYPGAIRLLLRAGAGLFNTPLRLSVAPRHVAARLGIEAAARLRSIRRRGKPVGVAGR